MRRCARDRVRGAFLTARWPLVGIAFVLIATGLPPRGVARVAETPVHRANSLLARMTMDEKLNLVCCGHVAIRRLGIPSLNFVDGPNGIGEGNRGVTAFPNAVNIGASWDPELARRYGAALGSEARATGNTLLAAPTLNIVRTPKWGRAAETYSEDPFLTASLAAPEVRGIQSANVVAQPKHFAGNNQEIGRLGRPLRAPAVDDRISMRALHEIYYPGFRAVVQQGGAASVMCSYNRVNGTPACQNAAMLDALKGWGLQGFVAPDHGGAIRDTATAANSGVDYWLSSGGTANFQVLKHAMAAGAVSRTRIDDAARRVLVGMTRAGVLDAPTRGRRQVASTDAHRALATDISAQATVLLQNNPVPNGPPEPVLPLGESDRTIAVIGYDAGAGTQIQEGGSAAVLTSGDVVTPVAGITARAPSTTTVTYAQGTRGIVPLPVIPANVLAPSTGTGPGLSGTFYTSPLPTFSRPPVTTRVDPTLDFQAPALRRTIPGTSARSARWTGTLTPPLTGEYRFSLTFAGDAKVSIGGTPVINGNAEWSESARVGFPGAPTITSQGVIDLTAGDPVPIVVEYAADASLSGAELHLGWQPPEPALRDAAVAAARAADLAVVFVNDVTSEGMDRSSLSLPGDQDQLIEAVADANPRTVVVLHTASAVLMPWRDRVAAIVEAWYPGQQSGTAIAKTLFGDVDPSGRLPVTFPALESQGPTVGAERYPGVDNVAHYREDLLVGYRFYDEKRQTPLFPFGYGLSYTTFSLSGLHVDSRGDGRYRATVHMRNTGQRAGAQVVQLYVGDPPRAGEPPRQLKAFRKVFLEAGEARDVTVSLDRSSFQIYDEAAHRWTITPGTYHLFAGTSSRDLPLRTSLAID